MSLSAAAIGYLNRLFPPYFMPSHDLAHHCRVRKTALQLSKEMTLAERAQLEFACLFHDTGMITNSGPEHGKASKNEATRFLFEQDLPITKFLLALDAIEHHDDKEYSIKKDHNPILPLLCIADDRDAYGKLGAYRYIEIYLHRGISIDELPGKICSNCTKRLQFALPFLPESLKIEYSLQANVCIQAFSKWNQENAMYRLALLIQSYIKMKKSYLFMELLNAWDVDDNEKEVLKKAYLEY